MIYNISHTAAPKSIYTLKTQLKMHGCKSNKQQNIKASYILKENLYTLYKQNLSQFFFDDKTNDILFKMKTKSIKTLLDVEYSYS